MSNACILPVGDMAASMALVWPPRPNVPSTYTPPGFGAIIFSTVSSHSAGWVHVDDPRPQVGAGPADGLFDGRHAVKRDPCKAPSQVEPWRTDDLPGWLEERIQLFRLGILQQVPHEDFVALLIFLRVLQRQLARTECHRNAVSRRSSCGGQGERRVCHMRKSELMCGVRPPA
eukprot:scaffold56171_cov63-Phaeocystis_antarctica.AAC.3